MGLDISGYPYFDDYDQDKDYVQIVALPGRVAQAREFTQAQTISRNIAKSIGDAIMKDGDIIEGCQVVISPTKDSVTVTAGRVYIDGIVGRFEEETISITGVGTEVIGIKATDTVITEDEDHTLRDPAQGYDNYDQPGSHRIKRELSLTVNDDSSAAITTLQDGEQFLENFTPEYNTLSQTLARRTFDESGSYLVNGMSVRVEESDDPSEYIAVVEPGKAYVLGYELSIPSSRRIPVERSLAYGPVVASNYVYQSGTHQYLLDKNNYVKEINSVSGQTPSTATGSVSSNTDMFDLGTDMVVSVSSVTQGGTNFIVSNIDNPVQNNVDCYLHRDGTHYYLVWNGTRMVNSLILGSIFTVNYVIHRTFVKDVDYELTSLGNSDYIEWIGASQIQHPIHGTNFSVEYDQYFARKDVVYIDMYGNVDVVKGIPSERGYEDRPEAPLNTLELALIDSPPNGVVVTDNSALKISSKNIGLTRFTMNDIHSIVRKMRTMEYDQAVLSLNTDARQVFTQHDKKGILTDPFIDLSRIDFFYNKLNGIPIDINEPYFEMSLDLDNNICYLPVITDTFDLVVDASRSSGHVFDRLMTLDTTGEKVVLSQLSATKLYQVNPYTVFPQLPEISLDPAVDNWVEDSIIQVQESLMSQTVVSTTTSVIESSIRIRKRFEDYTVESSTESYTQAGTLVSSNVTESVIREEAVTFVRQREVTVKGKDFYPGMDDIELLFEGTAAPLTPLSGTPSGTKAGTVQSKEDGSFIAKFTIPPNKRTGVSTVRAHSPLTNIAGYQNFAETEYQAHGIKRTIQRTVTTLTTVLLQRVLQINRTTYVDPLAQTFVLDKMTLLKGVDLYIHTKGDAPIVCEIRGVTHGVINDTIYISKSLSPSEINETKDSSTATRFNFPDPVLLEADTEYAFVVRSTSDRYLIWVAELGEEERLSGKQVLRNPYLRGLMFSSSNNSSWTAHQTTDIKFRLIEPIFTTSSIFYFNNLTGKSAARLYLTGDSALPIGTNIQWFYSVDGSSNYLPITPYTAKLLGKIVSSVDIRVQMSRESSTKLSPLLARDTVALVLSKWKLKGHYVSKNITRLDPYTDVKIIVDTFTPPSTSLVFKCSNDDGSTIQNLSQESSTDLGDGWSEKVFTHTYGASAEQLRIFITAESSAEYTTPVIKRLRAIMS